MLFEVYLHLKSEDVLNSMDSVTRVRIMNHLHKLVEEPDMKGKPLTSTSFKKMRIGVYRAIYELIWNHSKVNVLFIGHRSKVYDDSKRIFL